MRRFWQSIIGPLLGSIDARSVVEIGVGIGENSKNLLEFVKLNGGIVYAIDPNPVCNVEVLQNTYGTTLRFMREMSLNALPDIPQYDAVLIDGDHNWYTVFHELLLIEQYAKRTGVFPLVILHDTGWPYGRRDMYVNPEVIAPAYRYPYQKGGLVPSIHSLQPHKGLNATVHHAIYENGAHNGVLTAVEDFIAQTTIPLEFIDLPGWHGLGILVSRRTVESTPQLRTMLTTLHITQPVRELAVGVEHDRVKLYISNETQHIDAEHVQQQLKQEAESAQRQLKQEAESAQRQLKQEAESAQRQLIREREDCITMQEQSKQQIAEMQRRLMQAVKERHNEHMSFIHKSREQEQHIHHMIRSRSWRLTAPLRYGEATVRKIFRFRWMYHVFGALKDIWLDFGEPCPRFVRYIRHGVLGSWWPVVHEVPANSTAEQTADVAVIIPCHNYARFLADAIESVIHQTVLPREIVVVDDASTDNTKEIAAKFAHKGVRYIRGEWKSVGAARNAGIDATTAFFLIFLDADDLLHEQYIRLGVEILEQNPSAGIGYTNQTHFGDMRLVYEAPEVFDWRRFDSQNHISISAVVRRDAIVQAGKFTHGIDQDGDWITWRHILALGWTAVKFPGTLFIRWHGNNMTTALLQKKTYPERAGFFEEPATLFLALSGRHWTWPHTAKFLTEQSFPHHLIHLVILDTSQNPSFAQMVQSWLQQCDYRGYTFLQESMGPAGIADRNRMDPVNDRWVANICATIYNRFARMCTTALAFIIEDDVVPPTDAFMTLVGQFELNVASVSALYYHRNSTQPVAWEWNAKTGGHSFAIPKAGVRPIGGNGFGCVVLRGERFRRTVFHAGKPHGNFDHNFYKSITQDGDIALINWDLRCDHLAKP